MSSSRRSAPRLPELARRVWQHGVVPDLYPTFPSPPLGGTTPAALPAYPRSYRFLFDEGDFARDGTGRLVKVDGHEAWAAWCVKAAITARASYLVYGPRYGSEIATVTDAGGRALAEALVKRTITEALMHDARTKSVDRFAFAWVGDSLAVQCTVTPVVGSERRIEVRLTTDPAGVSGRLLPGS